MNAIGNTSAFSKDVVRIMVSVLGLGYMGGSMLSVLNLNGHELNELFPNNITKPPYSATPPDMKLSLDELKEKGLLYWFSQIQFPYTSMKTTVTKEPPSMNEAINWLKLTCAYVFIKWRDLHKNAIVTGAIGAHGKNPVMDFIAFYILPYLVMALIIPPVILPIYGYGLATYLSANIEQISHPIIYTYSFLMGWSYGFVKLFDDLTKFPGALVNMFIYGFGGMLLSAIKHPFWIGIGFSIWIFSCMYLFLSPFLIEDGVNKVIEQILDHKKGLLFIFMITVLNSARINLSPQVTLGAMIFIIGYYLYQLYQWAMTKYNSLK